MTSVAATPEIKLPKRDGTTMFATREGLGFLEVLELLGKSGLGDWYFAGYDAQGMHIARDLGEEVGVIAQELKVLAKHDLVMGKGPQLSDHALLAQRLEMLSALGV